MDDHLTIPEAAARGKVGQSTVKRWIRDGTLTPYRYPGVRRTYVLASELDALLAPDDSARTRLTGQGGTVVPLRRADSKPTGRKSFVQLAEELNEREAREKGR